MTHDLYYVTLACGFLVVQDDIYRCTYDAREATSFSTFREADRAAKDAVIDFLAEGTLDFKNQYFAIFKPAIK
jgi:hypothetical protein